MQTAEVALPAVRLHVVLGRIIRRLRQGHEPGDVRLTELSVLSRLDSTGPLPASTLAEHERVSPQAMSETVALLEAGGYARRSPDPTDGRRSVVALTAKGRRLLTSRRTRSSASLSRALEAAFSPEERAQVLAALPLLEKLADHL